MNTFKIKGTVQYQDISFGFWGIIDAENNKWRPSVMPEELQQEGLQIEATLEKAEEQMSIFMWGTAVNLIDFTVI